MDIQAEDIAQGIEPVTKSDLLELETWNQPRDVDQLRSFRESRIAAIGGIDE